MTELEKAARQALEALKECRCDPRLKYEHPNYDNIITALRRALAVSETHKQPAYRAVKTVHEGKAYYVSEPEQPAPVAEPVARSKAYDMIDRFLRNNLNSDEDYAEYSAALDSLYTSPPNVPTARASKPWVGLTDVEWMNIVNKDHAWFGQRPEDVAHEVAKLVEAKLKEKNNG